jgi:hypothetical protein
MYKMSKVYFKKIQYCFVEVDIVDIIKAKELVSQLIENSSKFTMLDLSNGNLNDEEMDDENKEIFQKMKEVYISSGEESDLPEFEMD